MLSVILISALAPGLARCQPYLPPALRNVGFDQKLDAQVPLDLPFKGESGRPVKLGDYFGHRPVIPHLAKSVWPCR